MDVTVGPWSATALPIRLSDDPADRARGLVDHVVQLLGGLQPYDSLLALARAADLAAQRVGVEFSPSEAHRILFGVPDAFEPYMERHGRALSPALEQEETGTERWRYHGRGAVRCYALLLFDYLEDVPFPDERVRAVIDLAILAARGPDGAHVEAAHEVLRAMGACFAENDDGGAGAFLMGRFSGPSWKPS